MKRLYKQLINITNARFYSFVVYDFTRRQTILRPGDILTIKGRIKNNGLRLGTTYLIIKLANPYDHLDLYFNTDTDFDETSRQALRFVDIPPFKTREFCCDIGLPQTLKRGVVDISLELWTPAKLFKESATQYNTVLFDRTPWRGFIEIVNPQNMITNVFISYSWHSKEHIKWVRRLSEELIKNKIQTILDQKDLFAGEEITHFMEQGAIQPICIAICSTSYTEKANNRSRGVGYEISILTNEMLEGRKRFTIIPVIRDNPSKRKPTCFGSALHVDMDETEWQAEPFSLLIASIKKAATKIK
jgi:hypothetical protein